MIDKTKPPPGFEDIGDDAVMRVDSAVWTIAEAHAIYAEESRPAVIEFAEQIAAWLEYLGLDFMAAQVLAAARGERTLP